MLAFLCVSSPPFGVRSIIVRVMRQAPSLGSDAASQREGYM